MRPDPLTVPVEHNGDGTQRQRDEAEQGVPPPESEGVVHGPSRQRQERTQQRAQDGAGGNGRGGVAGESIDQVRRDRKPREKEA